MENTSYSSANANTQPITVRTLQKMKKAGEKFVVLTVYDASFAAILEQAGVEVLFTGDSLGMVIQGHETTVPVTMDHMVYHTSLVSRVRKQALVMSDLPFMSFSDPARALDNATRLMQEAGAHIVKLEGGGEMVQVVENLAKHGVPVCGHLGLQPQAVHKLGGYRVQGRDDDVAKEMMNDAKAMQDAGADMLLLECVPQKLAKTITESLTIPTIGIGAGRDCDAQVLVLYDLLGISHGHRPKFAKDFLRDVVNTDTDGEVSIEAAVRAYVQAVKQHQFPDDEHSFN
ncbi:3-methyl-2-oxobutanoate hydroxymethyltransferase [hydrothermal vent metagenome]|uniref:3-methyl-2-oxobutanoate hydroxymethyltransferase n=1 Tax=hydrothermal vent metagenome TaxID=652676 RepID=A0A3B1AQS8_9ZZZZ